MIVKFKRVHHEAIKPEYKTKGAACADLYAVFDDLFGYTYVYPNETAVIQTGLEVEVPEGYEMQVRARSGVAAQGVMLANGVGTIDSDYRGEVKVLLTNASPDVVKITSGQRIAQCCLKEVIKVEFEEVDELSDTERGGGGLGSTGS